VLPYFLNANLDVGTFVSVLMISREVSKKANFLYVHVYLDEPGMLRKLVSHLSDADRLGV
jgi:hypothetical protein